MEISVKKNYGYTLIFQAENVSVEEDIEDRIYPKTDDGKTDFSKPPQRDIKTDILDQITSVLIDMIYYREREYESGSLIGGLFEKLPDDSAKQLLAKLNKTYTD